MNQIRMKFAACLLALGCVINSTSAQTVIYSDNFDIPDTGSLDGSVQTGRHTGIWATNIVGRSGGVQHTITSSNLNLLPASGTAAGRMRFHSATNTGLRFNFAQGEGAAQILADGGMRVSFDWTAAENTLTNWISYSVGIDGSDPGIRVSQAATDSGILLRNSGGHVVFQNGVTNSASDASFDVSSLSRHVDLDYAFSSFADGSPVILKAYVNSVLVATHAFTWNGNLGVLHMEMASLVAGTRIDNLTISSFIPSPYLQVVVNTAADSPPTNHVGRLVNLSATIGGTVPILYQWKVNKGSGFVDVSSSATNTTLALLNAQISDTGLYSLFATNSAGSTNTASLPLTFINSPGGSILMNVQFNGQTGGGPAVGTQKNGAVIGVDGDVWNPIFTTVGSFTAGVAFTCTNTAPIYLKHSGNIGTLNTLSFVADYIHTGGQGTFANTSVSNLMNGLLGMQSSRTGTVTVSNLSPGTYDLYLYGVNAGAQTRSSTFNANGIAAVCGPNRSANTLVIQSNYVHMIPTVAANGTLTITFVGAASGDAQFNGFQLSGPLALPTLSLSQDTAVNTPTTVYAGYDATFSASFGGTQPITNQWKVDKGIGFQNISGATNASLTLTNLQPSDTGSYALFASNPAGSSNSTPLLLTVLPAPTNLTINAQFVGSAFGGGNAPTQVGDVLIGTPTDVWNTFSNPNGGSTPPPGRANATNLAIVDANNFGTTVKLDYVADYVFSGAFAGPGPFLVAGSPYANLMTGYMGTVLGDTNTVILRNLPAGPYDLYLYASGRSDGQTRVNKFAANGMTATCGPNSGNSSLIPAVNYVHLTPTVDVDGILKITVYGTDGEGLMNGFQLNGPVSSYTLFLSVDTTSDSPPTNYVGRTVSLSATFGGNPTPSLQWKVDKGSGFVDVSPSATNSVLTLVNVQTGDTGSYALYASNFVDSLSSTPITMAVIPTPTSLLGVNVNVQFVGTSRGSGEAAIQTGPAAVGNPDDFWNRVKNPNPVLPDTSPISGAGQILTDAANVGTSMALDYTGTADLNSGVDNPFYFSGSPAENLMKAALTADNTNATVTVHGILPGTYDLYLYSSGNLANQGNVTEFTVNGVTGVAGPNAGSGTLTEVTNYVHLTPTVTGNGLLHISFVGTAGPASQLNGFQLIGPSAFLPPNVVLDLQRTGSQLTLTWPNGTLLESTNILGPWTTNANVSPYTFTITNTIPEKYFRVQVQ